MVPLTTEVPGQKRHIVGAGPVGLLRVDDRLPLALRVQADPALVRIRPPRIELFLSGVGLGLVVPLAPRMVFDLLEVGGLRHGHVEAELVDMVHGHLALVRRTSGRHCVRRLVPSDFELAGNVAIVVGPVDEPVVVHGVFDAVGFDHVAETHLVAAAAGAVCDGGAVRHPVGAHAVLDLLDRGLGRHRAHLPGFGRVTVRGVHGRLHAVLLGHLDVDPVRALGPVFHAEILRRGEIVELSVPIAGEADRLAHALRGQVGAVLVMDDRGAVQRLLDRGTAVVGVDDVADRVGGADLHVGLLLVAGGHVQLVIDRRLVLRQHNHAERGVRVGVDRLLRQRVNAACAELVLPRGRGRVLLPLIRVVALRLGPPLRLPTILRIRTHIAAIEQAVPEPGVSDGHHTTVRVSLTRIGAPALIDRVAQGLVHVHVLVRAIRQVRRQRDVCVAQR